MYKQLITYNFSNDDTRESFEEIIEDMGFEKKEDQSTYTLRARSDVSVREMKNEIVNWSECVESYFDYALGDQLRRAVVSVPSNIAEGSGRSSLKEKIHFLEIAYGSLTETLCQLDIAHDLSYISDGEFCVEKERINVIGKQLSGLRSSFQRQLEESANR